MVRRSVHRMRQRLSEGSLDAAIRRIRERGGRALGRAADRVIDGTPIWEHDWDVLCVLDGCRVDLMREVACDGHPLLPAPEDVSATWSVGSQSAEWMAYTFDPSYAEVVSETGYITGNPFSAQSCDHMACVSGNVLPLQAEDFGFLYELWREEWQHGAISTIPPEPLTNAAIGTWRARRALDIDRIVVHYMQPHAPFRSRPDWFLGEPDLEGWGQVGDENGDLEALADLDPAEADALEAFAEADGDGITDPWTRLRDGELPRDEFWAAYRDNLEWVLDSVATLAENCDGTVALTSDHGNAAGEWGVWSHPPGLVVPALRRVPWVALDGRDTESRSPGPPPRSPPTETRDAGEPPPVEPAVEERLADLGYQ